ncbi:hypothetical protein HMN09_00135700 [Mycena chlorophos]|uniref:C2H2-type domain-containing protein n=1 Tax=Mycena chlorophos TaxID=658473 RepID=A0A8H6TMX2_MYCCL|nr:hypothetical protein HMN09_00135700 [Mycena chlorophos]
MPKDSSKTTTKGAKKGGKTSAKAWSRGANGMYECPSCHRCYTSEYHLQRHQNDVHDKQRPFACPWTSSPCFKDFANRQNLATHIRAAHTRETPYSCALCRWACPDMTGVKNHLRRHHGRNARATDIVHDKSIGLRAQALATSVQAGVPVAPAAAPSEPEAGPSSLSVTPETTDDEPTSESEENFTAG